MELAAAAAPQLQGHNMGVLNGSQFLEIWDMYK